MPGEQGQRDCGQASTGTAGAWRRAWGWRRAGGGLAVACARASLAACRRRRRLGSGRARSCGSGGWGRRRWRPNGPRPPSRRPVRVPAPPAAVAVPRPAPPCSLGQPAAKVRRQPRVRSPSPSAARAMPARKHIAPALLASCFSLLKKN